MPISNPGHQLVEPRWRSPGSASASPVPPRFVTKPGQPGLIRPELVRPTKITKILPPAPPILSTTSATEIIRLNNPSDTKIIMSVIPGTNFTSTLPAQPRPRSQQAGQLLPVNSVTPTIPMNTFLGAPLNPQTITVIPVSGAIPIKASLPATTASNTVYYVIPQKGVSLPRPVAPATTTAPATRDKAVAIHIPDSGGGEGRGAEGREPTVPPLVRGQQLATNSTAAQLGTPQNKSYKKKRRERILYAFNI